MDSINIRQPQEHNPNKECKRDDVTKLQACKICGEIGHTSKECQTECPHFDGNHIAKNAPPHKLHALCVKGRILFRFNVNYTP